MPGLDVLLNKTRCLRLKLRGEKARKKKIELTQVNPPISCGKKRRKK
jgi:hypothetical protein